MNKQNKTRGKYAFGLFTIIRSGFILGCITLSSCMGDDLVFRQSMPLPQPANFPEPVYTLDNNPPTKEGFELGRMLFYDPSLSRDGSVSCSSCHQPFTAFADPVHRFSVGVDFKTGTRNAPPLFNLAFQPFFFWDGGVNHLDFAPLNAIQSEVEMDESVENIVRRLNENQTYREKFRQVFEQDSIDSRQLLHALSQFMMMLVSANAPYDQYVRNEGYMLSAQEKEGLVTFQQKCATCHTTDLFTDFSFRNNGLDSDFTKDEGRMRITELPEDAGKFMVPSLRNVALTAPYMHDGRFNTLTEVLDHYTQNVKDSETLDPLLKQNGKPGISLSGEEKEAVLAFLQTLTDESFVRNPQFFDPF